MQFSPVLRPCSRLISIRALPALLGAAILLAICGTDLAGQTPVSANRPHPVQQPTIPNPPPIPLTPKAAPTQSQPVPAIQDRTRVPSFKGVTPGQTRVAEAKTLVGATFTEATQGDQTTLTFRLEPFDKVDVIAVDGVVASIVIHLREPTATEAIAKEVGIVTLQPAPVPDETGQILGVVYPERGILFGFAAAENEQKVAQIILEPIRAEPFILRAKYGIDYQYQAKLADLSYALELDPDNAYAHWLLADTYATFGNFSAAEKHAEEAVRLDGQSANYRLTEAYVLAAMGAHARAMQLTTAVLDDPTASAEVRARAQCQLGDLLASGPQPDFTRAMQHHQGAIELAVPLATDPRLTVRAAAKRILVDAHLGVAGDVALGRWKRKEEVVPKWLNHADAIANQIIKREHGDPSLMLRVRRSALAVFAELERVSDPTSLAVSTMRDGQQLIAANRDPLYRAQIQRELGESLFHVAAIQQRRNLSTSALQYAEQALRHLEQSRATAEQTTPQQDYQLGRLCYLIGSIHATKHNNHQAAMVWYERARPLLDRIALPPRDLAVHGERLVGMGVSYWQTGVRDEALELTKQGTSLLQQAVGQQLVTERALVIPYGNLAGMHQQLGREQDARRFAETAAKLRAANDEPKRR